MNAESIIKKRSVRITIISILSFILVCFVLMGIFLINLPASMVANLNQDPNSLLSEWVHEMIIYNFCCSKKDIESFYTDFAGTAFLYSENDLITKKQKDLAAHIIKEGFNINRLDCSGQTALFLASYNNKVNTTEWLLSLGADPLVRADGQHGECVRPHLVKQQNSIEIAKQMHERHGALEKKNGKPRSPENDYTALIELLSEHVTK